MEENTIEEEMQESDKKQFVGTILYSLVIIFFMITGYMQEREFGVIFFIFQLLHVFIIIMGIKFNSIILKRIGFIGAIIRVALYLPIVIMFLMPGFLFYDNGVYTPPVWRKLLIFDVLVMTPLYCISYMVYFDKIMKLRRKIENYNSNKDKK